MWNSGLLWAITVAQTVEQLLPKKVHSSKIFANGKDFECNEWYYIQSYQNGNEQGIAIWIPHISGKEFGAFSICKCRRGDVAGFYFGRYAMQSLSHDAYENGFNAFEDSLSCAREIVRRINIALENKKLRDPAYRAAINTRFLTFQDELAQWMKDRYGAELDFESKSQDR